jgi:hypothetical protein
VMSTSMLVQPPASWISLWQVGPSKAGTLDWPMFAANARRSNCRGCPSASVGVSTTEAGD